MTIPGTGIAVCAAIANDAGDENELLDEALSTISTAGFEQALFAIGIGKLVGLISTVARNACDRALTKRPTRADAITRRVAQNAEDRAMSPGPTTLESRLAQIIRLTCSDREGEVISAIHAFVRTLKAAGTDKIHELADRLQKPIEKSNGNALNEAEARRLYDEGYAAGVRAAESKYHGVSDFHGIDGKPSWEDVALFCQREKHRVDARHHEFIDDMASRSTWGREPTEKQHKYLHSLFFKLGAKIK